MVMNVIIRMRCEIFERDQGKNEAILKILTKSNEVVATVSSQAPSYNKQH